MPRLQRLARFYRVPVDQMLPSDDELEQRSTTVDEQIVDLVPARCARRDDRPVTIDLGAVEQLGGQEGEMLARYLRMIQVQRGDYNGRMLTIRARICAPWPASSTAIPSRCRPGSTAWACAWSADHRLILGDHGRPPPLRCAATACFARGHPFRPPDPFGVYVHVPFCSARCDYCAFATWTDRHHLQSAYLDACRATSSAGWPPGCPWRPASSSAVARPRRRARAAGGRARTLAPRADCEVTVECNPDTVTRT